jgi:ATP-binding cassette subfamily B (MDR/TAP) protein 1
VTSKRYKARLVARGFTQKEGVDFNDVFSPVVNHKSIRILLAMMVEFDLELEQMDVKTTLLYGDIDEIILMRQPEGYAEKSKEDYVCKLNRYLYVLKQYPRQWNKTSRSSYHC